MPLADDIRAAMTGGGNLTIEFDPVLNTRASGSQQVYLHAIPGGVRIDLTAPGDQATILWLPWRQGELTELQPYSIQNAADDTLFFTYYLSGCKVFAIQGGPVWHIDAEVTVAEFWPQILDDDWVAENWDPGTAQMVAYIRRAGQNALLWDLSAYLQGNGPTTYGANNIGQAIVGGIVTGGMLDFYYQSSPWASLPYSAQVLKSK
jgi:hypothetical protein